MWQSRPAGMPGSGMKRWPSTTRTPWKATLELLAQHPELGTLCDYAEPQLAGLRFYLVEKPFDQHLIYYRISGGELVAFRVVPGARDLPRRLLDPPGAE